MLQETILNVLKKHNIANLAREEIASELMAAINATRLDLPMPTGDPIKDIGEWERISAMRFEREQAEKAMLDRLEKALGITPNGRPEWDKTARFLIEREKDGETIETFAKNCKLDPFSTPKAHQLAKDPMQIRANWKHVMAVNAPKDYSFGVPEETPAEEEAVAPEMTAIEEAWLRVTEQLAADMPKVTFGMFVLGSIPLGYQDNIFKVGVPTDFEREWLTQRLTNTINRLLAGILNDPDVRVEFVVNEEER